MWATAHTNERVQVSKYSQHTLQHQLGLGGCLHRQHVNHFWSTNKTERRKVKKDEKRKIEKPVNCVWYYVTTEWRSSILNLRVDDIIMLLLLLLPLVKNIVHHQLMLLMLLLLLSLSLSLSLSLYIYIYNIIYYTILYYTVLYYTIPK